MKLTKAHIVFLQAVKEHGPTFRKGLPAADREQKQARQDCVKWKMATYGRDGWWIRVAGLQYLASLAATQPAKEPK